MSDSSSAFIIPVSKEVNLEQLYVYKDKGTDGKWAISPCFIHSWVQPLGFPLETAWFFGFKQSLGRVTQV